MATLLSEFILTFLLIMIYDRIRSAEKVQANESKQQKELLREQKDTQKEQQKLFEANHQPLIRETYWNPFRLNNKNGLDIECVNKGNGPAKNLQLECNISVPNLSNNDNKTMLYNSFSEVEQNMEVIIPEPSPLVDDPYKYSRGTDGAVLSSSDGTHNFFSAIEFSKVSTESDSEQTEENLKFNDVVDHLKKEEYKKYHLEFSLYYENILGETETYTFFKCWGDTESDFRSIIQEAKNESKTTQLNQTIASKRYLKGEPLLAVETARPTASHARRVRQ